MMLYFTPTMWQKLRYYVQQCPTEISGLGTIEQQGTDFFVTDLVILDQVVSGAHTDMVQEALDKFIFEHTKKKDIHKWVLWWHSHAQMKAFFSAKDDETIDASTEYDWLISLVTNHEMDTVAHIDQHRPFRASEKLKVEIITEDNEKLKATCLKEIQKKVKEEVPELPAKTRYVIKKNWNRTTKMWEEEQEQEYIENLTKSKEINLKWNDPQIETVFKESYEGVEGAWLCICYHNGNKKYKAYHDHKDLPAFTHIVKKKNKKSHTKGR